MRSTNSSSKNSSGKGPMMRSRQKQRMSRRMVILAASSFMMVAAIGLVIYFQFSKTERAYAAPSSGDYRSKTSGNWGSGSTWEKYNGSGWVGAGSSSPTFSDGVITIQSGHTVTVAAAVSVDQVVVDAGGQITVSGGTMTLRDGALTDMTVNGTLNVNNGLTTNNGSTVIINGTGICSSSGNINIGSSGASITIASGGLFRKDGGTMSATTWIISNGATYRHNLDGSSLPTATWGTTSNCEILGVVSTVPTNLAQSFGNFTWNCPSQTGAINLGNNLQTVTGNFTMTSTGTGSVKLSSTVASLILAISGNYYHQGGKIIMTESGNWSINVAGNFTMSGGSIIMTDGTAIGDGTPSLNVTGSVSMTAGTIDMSQYTASNANKGIGTWNVYSAFSFTGGTITVSSAGTGSGMINFAGTASQSFTSGGTFSNEVDFTVNNAAILNLSSNILSGGRNFTVSAGGTVILGDPNGITLTGSSGNIQVPGTRSYSTDGKYTYKGSEAQVSGNGLPAIVNSLTVDNTSGLTMTNSCVVNYNLIFTNGNITAITDTLGLGFNNSNIGTITRTTGMIYGYFKRWVSANAASNYLFPIGNNGTYRGVVVNYTASPSTGDYVVCSFTAQNPGNNGLPLIDAGTTISTVGTDGYWNLTEGASLSNGTYTIDIYAYNFGGVLDYSQLHVLRRVNSSSPWTATGTHVAATGSNNQPIAHRSALTVYGQFGVFSTSVNPLPIVLLFFKAKHNNGVVDLTWATASEINNEYFTIERSRDGKTFEEVLRKPGAGNSTKTLYYSATDDGPLKGMSYYRLKQTDYDGKFEYSPVKMVKIGVDNGDDAQLKVESIAPNPFTSDFAVSYTIAEQGSIDIQIFNSSGQMVYKETVLADKGFNSYQFYDHNGLQPGFYFVNLIFNGEMVSKKVIKR